MTDWQQGYVSGQLQLITKIKDLLENSEHRISIISLLALLDNTEALIEKIQTEED